MRNCEPYTEVYKETLNPHYYLQQITASVICTYSVCFALWQKDMGSNAFKKNEKTEFTSIEAYKLLTIKLLYSII